MLTPIILVLGLMLGTAVIAYWSDNLGKKLGKKRVSLFGLRPKQTATLITITSSMPIMLFTLAATLAVYKPLRDALTKFEATRRENAFLLEQNEFSQKRLARASDQEKQAGARAQQAERKERAANRNAQQAASKEATAKSNLSKAERDLAQANALVQGAKQREEEALGGARAAREGAREAKNGERAARDAERQAQSEEQQARSGEGRARAQERQALSQERQAQQKLQFARQGLRLAQAGLSLANAKLANTNAKLSTTQAQLVSERAKVTSTRATIVDQGRTLLAQGQSLLAQEGRVTDLKSEVDRLSSEATRSQIAAQLADVQLRAARSRVDEVLRAPTLAAADETLAVRLIAPRQTLEQVQSQLASVVDEARIQARRLGEQAPRVGQSVSGLDVGIEIPPQRVTLPNGTGVDIGREQQFAILASSLAGASTAFSVRVVAARLHTVGEPVILVRLIPVQVRVVFGAGEVLAATNIDGRTSDARIFKRLLDLANEGQRAAELKGVRPPLSRDVPFYAPLTNERIFEALRAIQALKGPARVRIVAVGSLLTSSPLNVRFDVAAAARQSA